MKAGVVGGINEPSGRRKREKTGHGGYMVNMGGTW